MPADLVRGRLDLMLLALLASGPGHGYGLIGELRRRTGGFLELPEGSMYPALHRLEQAGLIAGRSANTQGRGRRVYHITRVGKAELSRQRRDWWRFASAVEGVLREVTIRFAPSASEPVSPLAATQSSSPR